MTVTYPRVLFPDAEYLLVTALTPLISARVLTDLPDAFESAPQPIVRVERIGGPTSVELVKDEPRMDVETFAATKTIAADLALEIASILPTLRGQTIAGGVVVDVSTDSGPARRPDFNPKIRRYGLTSQLTIRPA